MTNSEAARWKDLNATLRGLNADDPSQLRDAIAAVYETIAASPFQVLQDFRHVEEAVLAIGSEARAARVARSDINVAIDADEHATIIDAARLLRALEVIWVEGTGYIESDRDVDLERAWMTSDERNYVIPNLSTFRSIDGKPFLRRALVNCRVIPTRISSFSVRLHRSRAALDRLAVEIEEEGKARRYGAALFPGLKAVLLKSDTEFLVKKLDGCDARAVIDTHLEKARSEKCATIVWGELSMPETSVAHVRRRLADEDWNGKRQFRYLVAGSWHRDLGGMRNVTPVLDGNGDVIFEALKWAKFDFEGRSEGIVPGDEIHVLILEDELVTVAVCRDFLECTIDPPHRLLNVDVAIVPSMIPTVKDRATLSGHAATANTMRVRFGTRTLVVAQPAIPRAGGTGLVMGFPSKPLEDEPIVVKGDWRRVDLEPS